MGWSFSIGHKPTTGIDFWDIRFRGERIAWELSLQEAYAAYGGASPMQSHVQYLDSHFGLGAAYKELVAGVDCPLNAAYLDLPLVFMSGPVIIPNAVCIFEISTGRPLIRHFSDAGGGAAYYGAVVDSTLVVRGISTIYNYDYVEDLVLHLDGSLQVAVHTTGYPQSAWFSQKRHGNAYGYPFWYDDGGTIHDHQLHWKVDLDIAGTSNSVRFDQVVSREIKPDNAFPGATVPWYSKRLQQVFLEHEAEAALFWNGSSKADPGRKAPVALQFIVNEDEQNKWGSARGYRIQHTQGTNQVLPENFTATHGFSWSSYQIAVTRREESEPSSSSQLNQALPFAPAVDFQQQLLATAASLERAKDDGSSSDSGGSSSDSGSSSDNGGGSDSGGGSTDRGGSSSDSGRSDLGDPIRRQDLVLWVTSGLQHIPGSEDAPVTPTTGPAIGFWLRPFNYFDESAAASQPDIVYIPALTRTDAQAAADAAGEGNTSFTLAPAIASRISSTSDTSDSSSNSGSSNSSSSSRSGGNSAGGSGPQGALSSALPGVGRDSIELVTLGEPDALVAARCGVQPYIGLTLSQTCIPNFPTIAFNSTYAQFASEDGGSGAADGEASTGGGNISSVDGSNITTSTGGGSSSTGRTSSWGGGATQGGN